MGYGSACHVKVLLNAALAAAPFTERSGGMILGSFLKANLFCVGPLLYKSVTFAVKS
jgi:hypothetical protein